MPPLRRWFFISLWRALAASQNRFPPFWGAADSDGQTAGTVRPNPFSRSASPFCSCYHVHIPFRTSRSSRSISLFNPCCHGFFRASSCRFFRSASPIPSYRITVLFVSACRLIRFASQFCPYRLAHFRASSYCFVRSALQFLSFHHAVLPVPSCRFVASLRSPPFPLRSSLFPFYAIRPPFPCCFSRFAAWGLFSLSCLPVDALRSFPTFCGSSPFVLEPLSAICSHRLPFMPIRFHAQRLSFAAFRPFAEHADLWLKYLTLKLFKFFAPYFRKKL